MVEWINFLPSSSVLDQESQEVSDTEENQECLHWHQKPHQAAAVQWCASIYTHTVPKQKKGFCSDSTVYDQV